MTEAAGAPLGPDRPGGGMSYGATGGGDDGSASTPSGGDAPPTAQRPAAWQSTIRGLHTMQYMEDGQAESMGRAAIEEARQRSQRSNSSFSRRGDGSASGGSTRMALPSCCSVDGVLSRTPLIYALLLNGGLVVALIGCNDAKSAWSDLGLLSAPSSYSAKMQWARHVYQVSFFASLGVLFMLAAAVWRWGTSLARATLRIASVDDDIPTAPLILALISMRASACMYGAAAMCMIAGEVVALRKDFSSHHDLMTISELGESYDALILLGGLLVQLATVGAFGRVKLVRPLLLSAWMFTVYGLGCEANFVTLTSCLVFVGLLQLDFATSPLIPPAPTAARDSQPTTPAPERRPRVAWVLWLLMLASTLLLIATYVIDEQEGELETDKVKRKRKAAADDD